MAEKDKFKGRGYAYMSDADVRMDIEKRIGAGKSLMRKGAVKDAKIRNGIKP